MCKCCLSLNSYLFVSRFFLSCLSFFWMISLIFKMVWFMSHFQALWTVLLITCSVIIFMINNGACCRFLRCFCSFCKGRTLYSVVRDSKSTLDINKTRQIAQEIVKVIHFLIDFPHFITENPKWPVPTASRNCFSDFLGVFFILKVTAKMLKILVYYRLWNMFHFYLQLSLKAGRL